MAKNNIKVKCIESGTTKSRLVEDIWITNSYINHIIKNLNGVINNIFVNMMCLGYSM